MAIRFKPCSVEGCNGNAHYTCRGRRGWCSAHWHRWKRHGTPLGGGTRKFGAHGPTCMLDGCSKPYYAQGMCAAHYTRRKRNGDPLSGGITPGEADRFFREVVVPYDGDECLYWPYATIRGYGKFWYRGRVRIVSSVLCEEVHGAAPTPQHEAAHSCGNGSKGCVTQRHLRWATRIENQADRILHGTTNRGERQGGAKLTTEDVLQIRSLCGKVAQKAVGERFGINKSYVGQIMRRERWAHIIEAD